MPGAIFGGVQPASIGGSAVVGATLSCTLAPGYSGSPAYQWLRDGVAISGATASTYLLVSGDAGHVISCRVTGITYVTSGFSVGGGGGGGGASHLLVETGDVFVTEAGDRFILE